VTADIAKTTGNGAYTNLVLREGMYYCVHCDMQLARDSYTFADLFLVLDAHMAKHHPELLTDDVCADYDRKIAVDEFEGAA